MKICVENYERCPFQVNIKRLEILKLEYNDIHESSSQGAIVRSKATWYAWYEKGNMNNAYFARVPQKKKLKALCARCFINMEGILITDPKKYRLI